MVIRRFAIAAVLLFAVIGVGLYSQEKKEEKPAAAKSAEGVVTYKIDPVHSSVVFRVKHMNLSYFYGRFNEISGTITWDDRNPDNCAITAQVAADSVDTRVEKRNQHLKSPDFFNALEFPTIQFKSRKIEKAGEGKYKVVGDLTLHGVTKPLMIEVEKTGEGKGPTGAPSMGGQTAFTIKRTDFGMNFLLDGVSDEVVLTISVEAGRQ